jgi:hypothetical protein
MKRLVRTANKSFCHPASILTKKSVVASIASVGVVQTITNENSQTILTTWSSADSAKGIGLRRTLIT